MMPVVRPTMTSMKFEARRQKPCIEPNDTKKKVSGQNPGTCELVTWNFGAKCTWEVPFRPNGGEKWWFTMVQSVKSHQLNKSKWTNGFPWHWGFNFQHSFHSGISDINQPASCAPRMIIRRIHDYIYHFPVFFKEILRVFPWWNSPTLGSKLPARPVRATMSVSQNKLLHKSIGSHFFPWQNSSCR